MAKKKKGEWGGFKTVYFTRMRERTHGPPKGKNQYDAESRRQNTVDKRKLEDYDDGKQ